MNSSWEIIVEHFRNELQGYGGLLQLFDDQQERLLHGDSNAVLLFANEIEAQARVLANLRVQRENAVRAFAAQHAQPSDATLRSLLKFFPVEVRPMLSALMDEINHLIRRVRRGSQRNHQILNRVVTIHQETLRTLQPAAFSKIYSPHGRQVSLMAVSPAWHAAG